MVRIPGIFDDRVPYEIHSESYQRSSIRFLESHHMRTVKNRTESCSFALNEGEYPVYPLPIAEIERRPHTWWRRLSYASR